MNMFGEDSNTEMRVHFSFTNLGETHTMSFEGDDCTTWQEVLSKVVATLEASYGYTFDLPDDLGIYVPGNKKDD